MSWFKSDSWAKWYTEKSNKARIKANERYYRLHTTPEYREAHSKRKRSDETPAISNFDTETVRASSPLLLTNSSNTVMPGVASGQSSAESEIGFGRRVRQIYCPDKQTLGFAHGPEWVQNYIDSRPRVDRIIEPCVQQQGTRYLTANISAGSGTQNVTTITSFTKTNVTNLLASSSTNFAITGGTSVNTTYSALSGNTAILNTADTSDYFHIPLMQERLTLHNSGNTNCYVKIYEFECIENTATSASTFWSEALTVVTNEAMGATDIASYSTQANSFAPTDKFDSLDTSINRATTFVGLTPQGKGLFKHYRLVGKLNGALATSKNLQYTWNCSKKKFNQQDLDGQTFLKYCTKMIMIITYGEIVASANAGQTNVIGTSDTILRGFIEDNTACYGRQTAATKRIKLYDATYGTSASGGLAPIAATDQQVFNDATEEPDAGGFTTDA